MIQTSVTALLLPVVFLLLLLWNVNTLNNTVSASLVPGLEEEASAIEGRSLTTKKRHTKGHKSVRKSKRKGKKKTQKGKKKQDDDDFPVWALGNYDGNLTGYNLIDIDQLEREYLHEFVTYYNKYGLGVVEPWVPLQCCVILQHNGKVQGLGIESIIKSNSALLEPDSKNSGSTCTPGNTTLNGFYYFHGLNDMNSYRKLRANDFNFTLALPGAKGCECYNFGCPVLVRRKDS